MRMSFAIRRFVRAPKDADPGPRFALSSDVEPELRAALSRSWTGAVEIRASPGIELTLETGALRGTITRDLRELAS